MRDLELGIDQLRARVDEQDEKLAELYNLLSSPAAHPSSDRQRSEAIKELKRSVAKRPR